MKFGSSVSFARYLFEMAVTSLDDGRTATAEDYRVMSNAVVDVCVSGIHPKAVEYRVGSGKKRSLVSLVAYLRMVASDYAEMGHIETAGDYREAARRLSRKENASRSKAVCPAHMVRCTADGYCKACMQA